MLPGIAIAVALSILNVFRRAWRPYDTKFGRVDGLEGYHDVHSCPEAQHLPGLVIYRFDGPVFYRKQTGAEWTATSSAPDELTGPGTGAPR